ncbi:dihydropteroate synthase [Leptolyngbyaceae cyanobacterium CCMR0082]|uniref:Dihydropteroate synthase n=2 Tax=Adonisia turfae TaxID=2950184 RepID=A0A6M0SGA9_9CYAN|nr:dihydropteroate synthase [Adonisia turfae CCMR0081]NEZ67557.1 dihydropteroate synthase [Adonisia turfae CCMR0082]
MAFTVVTRGFKQEFERWTDALETANGLKPQLKSWFVDIRIFDGKDLVWMYSKLRAHPEYIGPGTYDRLARLFMAEGQQKVASRQAWTIRGHQFNWGERTYLMGVINITPDSFSDGGQFNSVETALKQAEALLAANIDILDLGGQSTRPGAEQISLGEELNRVIPVIEAIRQADNADLNQAVISVDTTRATVARAAVEAGADIINDISGATYEPDMLKVAAEKEVPIILMHLRGTPETMQQMTDYGDLMGEISKFLREQIEQALAVGVPIQNICIDPGIGFAKSYPQNLEILRKLPDLVELGCPILVGASRKSFIGWILDQPDPKQREWGTAAACTAAIGGGADILRVHNGAAMADVARVADAIWRQTESTD